MNGMRYSRAIRADGRRHHAVHAVVLLLAAGGLGIAACSNGDRSDPCLPSAPGVVVYRQGIDLVVRDAAGRGAAIGDTSITYRGADSAIVVGFDTLHLPAGFVIPGTYSVRVKRPFYRDAVIPSVTVSTDECGGPVTAQVPVALQLAPGAPALRSIALLGGGFLASPGATMQLVARFDADASVPTNVTWRLSDSSVASLGASGLLTARCTTKIVTDTVTALATADTNVRAHALFQVASQASCS
jgi:hypothetical protein